MSPLAATATSVGRLNLASSLPAPPISRTNDPPRPNTWTRSFPVSATTIWRLGLNATPWRFVNSPSPPPDSPITWTQKPPAQLRPPQRLPQTPQLLESV